MRSKDKKQESVAQERIRNRREDTTFIDESTKLATKLSWRSFSLLYKIKTLLNILQKALPDIVQVSILN